MTDTTTITVTDAVWEHLDGRKDRGESFDSVLREEFGLPPRNDDAAHDPPTSQSEG